MQREPRRHERPAADAVGERSRDRSHEHRHQRPREDAQPGAERRVALRGLEELAEQEDRAEHPEVHEQGCAVRGREGPVAEEAHREHRLRRAALPGDECREECCADRERGDDRRARPAVAVSVDEPPDDPEQPSARQCEAGDVERLVRPGALAEKRREREQDDPDGDVQPEDPLPRDPVDDGAADERTHGDGKTCDPGPRTERETALLTRDSSAEDGQRQRRHDRRAESLDRASRDQPLGGRRHRCCCRSRGEDADADHEHALAPEAIAERRSREHEHGERQRVGVDRPLELLDGRAEVYANDGKRRRDDEVVEHDHEERDRRDDERPERARAGFHRCLPVRCRCDLVTDYSASGEKREAPS